LASIGGKNHINHFGYNVNIGQFNIAFMTTRLSVVKEGKRLKKVPGTVFIVKTPPIPSGLPFTSGLHAA
jgi:hypothetical protein